MNQWMEKNEFEKKTYVNNKQFKRYIMYKKTREK